MNWNSIRSCKDLPEYGKYVLVIGRDEKTYNNIAPHICCMDDLEDGMEYLETGYFHWLTENGTRIVEVYKWCEIDLPKEDIYQLEFSCEYSFAGEQHWMVVNGTEMHVIDGNEVQRINNVKDILNWYYGYSIDSKDIVFEIKEEI